MAGIWNEVGRELALRMDEDLIGRLTREISIDVQATREWLKQRSLAFDLGNRSPRPTTDALGQTADVLIRKAVRRAGLSGALTGWAGLAGMPAEVGFRLLLTVRLAQQLAVVYGYDPSTDRGRILVRRALAAAYEVELPEQQSEGTRLRDLRALTQTNTQATSRTAWIAQAATRHTRRAVGRSLSRKVPGLGLAPGVIHARRTVRDHGHQMKQVLERLYQGPKAIPSHIEDALEVN